MPKHHHAPLNLARIGNSIVTRLLILALCIVIFGAVVRYYVLTNFLREDLSAVVEGQQLTLATYVARDIDNKIVQRQQLLEHLAATVPADLLTQPERLKAWLKEHYDDQTLFTADLFIVNTKRRLLANYPVLDTDYPDGDYIQAGLAGRPFIGQPRMGRATKAPILPMSAPIKDAGGEVQAVLVGVTALGASGLLDSLLQSRVGDAASDFLLVFPDSKLFVDTSTLNVQLKPTSSPGINALHDRAMAGFRGAGITLNAKGVEEVAAMASVPSAGWFIVARLPTSEAFATVDRTQHFLIKGAFLSILFFATFASIGLYFVFRHLFSAAAQADRMTRDELPHAPLAVVRDDEVGHLISAFNRLLVKLNDKQDELKKIAHHDTLTGLTNRHYLSGRLRLVLAQAQRNQTQVGLLFMDLDGFKHINDSLGHEAGDEVLRQVARRFSAVVRVSDTLARIGGDEFVVLLNDLGDNAEETLTRVATQCIDALAAPFFISGSVCIVGVSIGIALGDGQSSADKLLLAADRVMYQAKKTGRGRYLTYKL
ncbi:sensor domain-containing diguanylate cyclase [Pseudomonas sp. 10S4]|uniref:bifunctional diguanylate cyclase/phosphodiesterase n=2 Tax=unclassified Pseudomonas TaxID=196821 RepID=UPI002AC9CBA4|nr:MULTISPECIES: sensor domain-containing diguanylate cyclase [unclassified Pseudomonas]MEB0226037.1 sensor domain-containing diguanylate cyclase [Pseudomonas sp. 5S1]MEB0296508.1 sensor domain-containing diguanylate cyclase [Pseudomonas sp. 10S4]WPX16657.1 sensor domain-containing diguanylate cyclase [Pseudomonas sp. 10S4]